MKFLRLFFISLTILLLVNGCANRSYPTRDIDVLCHYMTWFKHGEKDGLMKFDHWQWHGDGPTHDPNKSVYGNLRDVASVYYPRIGAYDSMDPDVITYHILTAKAAGIEGFIVDWYGPGGDVDEALGKLFELAEKLDFKVGICYEEKTCFPDWNKIFSREGAEKKAIKDLEYLKKTYAAKSNYWRKDNKPGVFVFAGFGSWPGFGEKKFSVAEWKKITIALPDLVFIRQNFDSENQYVQGSFAWVGDADYTQWFYKTGDELVKAKKLGFYVGSANPGFDDRGVWGWGNGPRFEPRLGFENFDRYWRDFASSNSEIIQIVTWNDFEEGTVVEPTVQFGNLYLNQNKLWIDKIQGSSADESIAIETPYLWFVLKKFSDGDYHFLLNQAEKAMAGGDFKTANKLLSKVKTDSGIKIPLYINMNNEYEPFSETSVEGEKLKSMMDILYTEDNIAKLANISASSIEENSDNQPENVLDASLESRWSSDHKDNQWLMLDFGKKVSAQKVVIIWEDAYARKYTISVSEDAKKWQQVIKENNGSKGFVFFDLPGNLKFQYMKIDCLERGTAWGFSIRELGVLLTGKPKISTFDQLPSDKDWFKEDVVAWRENGFELKTRTYGYIETIKHFPYTPNGIIKFDVKRLGIPNFINFTFQVCMFDVDGNFLGVIEPYKRKKEGGKNIIELSKFKSQFKPGTKSVSFKLWLEGKEGGYIELSKFSYQY